MHCQPGESAQDHGETTQASVKGSLTGFRGGSMAIGWRDFYDELFGKVTKRRSKNEFRQQNIKYTKGGLGFPKALMER